MQNNARDCCEYFAIWKNCMILEIIEFMKISRLFRVLQPLGKDNQSSGLRSIIQNSIIFYKLDSYATELGFYWWNIYC